MSGSGDGGTPGCPAAAIFCDGFEGSTTLDSNWTVDNGDPTNTVAVTTSKAHSGTNSVQITIGTGKSATFIDETKGFPITGTLWGRVWLYVMTNPGAHEIYIESSSGMMTGNNGVRELNTYNGPDMRTNVDPVGTGEANGISTVALPQGTWTCFEWSVGLAGTMGSIALYMNGTEVAGTPLTFPSTGDVAIPSLIEQRIGYERYAAGAAGDVWIDDYAIGTSQLGCD